ncbi:MAG: SDR family NAD(P)-dependent oxidoreductase [Nocardioidaceae bacterium]
MTGHERTCPSTGSIVIVGSGPGIGASVARRFGRAGYAVGLVARNGDRLRQMAADLSTELGSEVASAVADATAPDQLGSAIRSLSAKIGAPAVLCFSPIPDVGLIRPVLETGPDELMQSLRLNVAGAAVAVEAVLPGMRAAGRGSLLFTTGSAALQPSTDRAASAVTTTAATVYIALLREALTGSGLRVVHTVIAGPIDRDRADAHDPDEVAADLWAQHAGKDRPYPSVMRLDD